MPPATDDGLRHYRVLGLGRAASQDDIKQAYRRLARTLHPDKGGSAAAFGALQAAFETLSDPKARAAYDTLASDLRFRPGAAAQPYGGSSAGACTSTQPPHASAAGLPPGLTEAALLQQLLQRGSAHPYAVFDPLRQLCVTCEVCRRPATQQCWTCCMDICDFCTRRQHWKGAVSLHWPLVNKPNSMLEQLGRRELELKRREDGQAYKEAQPDYRPQSEVQVLRQFQEAIEDILQKQQQQQKQPVAGLSSSSSSSNKSSSCLGGAPARHPTAAAAGITTPKHISSNGPASSSKAAISSAAAGSQPASGGVNQTSSVKQPSAFALPASTLLTPGSSGSLNTITTTTAISSNSSRSPPQSPGPLVSFASSSKAVAVRGGSSSRPANSCWEAWAAALEGVRQSLLGLYDNRLGRFYMWTQTECSVMLAVHLPTGGGMVPPGLTVQPTSTTLLVQHQGFAPVLNRAWSNPIDAEAGVSSWTAGDGQLLLLRVFKAQPGRAWTSCFKGDPHLARHLQSPYRLIQLAHEVHLELPVPFWVHPTEDVQVHIQQQQGLKVVVDGVMALSRSYYRDALDRGDKQGGSGVKVVDTSNSSWCLLDQDAPTPSSSSSSSTLGRPPAGALRRGPKLLSICLALPQPTEEEVMYKKGVRQNNASVTRSCPHGGGQVGAAFFLEDEDEWGLGPVLQALLFHETGRTWLAPKPWELAAGAGSLVSFSSSSSSSSSSGGAAVGAAPGGASAAAGTAVNGVPGSGRWVEDEQALPADVAGHLKWLRAAAAGAAAKGGASVEAGGKGVQSGAEVDVAGASQQVLEE